MNVVSSVSSNSLARRLSEFDPDVVQVYGLFHGISRTAISWAKNRHRRVLYVSDSELRSPTSRLNRLKRRLILPWYFRRIDAFLTVGDSNEAFYRHYGVPSSRLYRCPFPIDDESIQQARAISTHWRDEIRRRYRIPESSPVALCVGKLIPRKSFDHAITAIRELSATSPQQCPYLLIAGDGTEAAVLRKLAGPETSYPIRFAGFVAANELPAYYAASDFLIHPAFHDPHPLAVTEAVMSGLPVIVSDHVGNIGCSDDVRIGLNGFVYPYGDISALTSQIAVVTDDPIRRDQMSKASLAIAESRSMAHLVNAYCTAVTGVTLARRKS
jgi:glycosyltransferase involved in cell wall biosynthesis